MLQVGFATVLVFLTIAALTFLYQGTVSSLLRSITESLASGTTPSLDSVAIVANLEYERQKNMVLTVAGVLTAAVVFAWLITKIALTPTRNALRSQKQFVGNIAHELRTPLSIIKTNTEVMLFSKKLDADSVNTLRSNVEELDRISDIINNLLSMNSLLQPEKMNFQNVDLGSVVERVSRSLQELTEHKGVCITQKLSDYRTVWGNASAIEQIVMNIVKNATNYSLQGGEVSIVVEPTYRGQMELRVRDQGLGIPEKDLEHIFEPFYRGDASRNRKSGGDSGLGLAIVSELVKIHKGSIAIKSAPREGTTVTVTLPCGHETPLIEEDGRNEILKDFS